MTDTSKSALPKSFDHADAEPRLYEAWEQAGCFKPSGEGEPYCIVIPPPNVTGSLHMGHALNNTLQDILVRFNRMRGKDVLWQVGTDHAGIATQMVVERQMMERQEPSRREIGREAFVEKVWAWKAESAGSIQNQLRRLGASCDWSRERFTMDEGLSAAVRKVFVQLYKDGLIYRDKRLVNWDPKLRTAISDLEVEQTEINGHMWHFKYPLADGETYEYVEKDEDGNITFREVRDYISIATTRPETMLGDGAVAVHPDDERYAPIVGKFCEIPVGPKEHRRLIPIITDEYPDPDFGSGAVKITGAHDFNDYEVAKRNKIPMYRLMDEAGAMRSDGAPYTEEVIKAKVIVDSGDAPDTTAVDLINLVPEDYRGLDRFAARKKVIADIDAEGLMLKVEDKLIQQPFGDRSGVVIEPMLTDQWYVDAETLSKEAFAAVEDGRTRFIPESWKKTYDNWLNDIQPWCISRQLWWGHQIPVWYGPDGTPFCAENEHAAQVDASEHYGCGVELIQDEDVLDTWFSSALWPFSTLGWPDQTPELARYYPTATLSTAFDIIFFWVARMMMMGLYFMKEVPFRDVYIHAIVRDEHGQKMSKSKGNVVDPLVKMDEYGTDSLRFTLAAMAAPGRDVKLSDSRIEGYRNFRTKLWNAARFAQMNECVQPKGFDPKAVTSPLCRWIIHEADATEKALETALDTYRFDDAANTIYQFTWNIYCDWFLEFAKPVFHGEDELAKAETRATGAWALNRILTMLHPFMPFVTEEIYQQTDKRDGFLMSQPWQGGGCEAPDAAAALNFTIDLISGIRSVRTEMNVPPKAQLPLVAISADKETRARLDQFGPLIGRLARVDAIIHSDEAPKGSAQIIVGGVTYALPIADFIDLGAELARLEKEISKTEGEIKKIDGKLGNDKFMAKAPENVIAEQHSRKAAFTATLEKLEAALARLKSL
ncbi:MAG: valine--tRNA ligase [Parvularcula sp.]